jgi:hypothetical protein
MKKLLVGAALVGICLTTMGAGMIPEPWNIAMPSSTWTAVTASRNVVEFQLKSRSNAPFKIASESDGAKYYSVASSGVVTFDMPAQKGAVLFYVQPDVAPDTLEVLLLNK